MGKDTEAEDLDLLMRYCQVEIVDLQALEKNKNWLGNTLLIVPESYLSRNMQSQAWYVSYPDPPHSTQVLRLLDRHIKDPFAVPPSSWTDKHCKVLNYYNTYEEAVASLSRAQTTNKLDSTQKRKRNEVCRTRKTKKSGIDKLKPISEMLPALRTKQSAPTLYIASSQDATQMSSSQSATPADKAASSSSNVGAAESVTHHDTSPTEDENSTLSSAVKQSLFSVPIFKDILADHGSFHTQNNSSSRATENFQDILADHDSLHTQNNSSSRAREKEMPPQLSPSGLENSSVWSNVVNISESTDIKSFIRSCIKEEVTEIVQNSEKKITREIASFKKEFHKEMKEVGKALLAQKPVQDLNSIVTRDDLANLYGFNFPLTDFEEFEKFDSQMHNNYKEIRSKLTKYITSTTSATADAKDSINRILEKLIDKKVLVLYTSQKKSTLKQDKNPNRGSDDSSSEEESPASSDKEEKQLIFKDTSFFAILRDTLFIVYNTKNSKKPALDETTILKAIGSIINSKKTSVNKSNSKPKRSHKK